MAGNINYHRDMLERLDTCNKRGETPHILLHACCAPCASSCLEVLDRYADVTVFFYNPNISTKEEYDKRLDEELRFVKIVKENGEAGADDLSVYQAGFDHEEWLQSVKGLEDAPEGGERCRKCFRLRLERTFREAVHMLLLSYRADVLFGHGTDR